MNAHMTLQEVDEYSVPFTTYASTSTPRLHGQYSRLPRLFILSISRRLRWPPFVLCRPVRRSRCSLCSPPTAHANPSYMHFIITNNVFSLQSHPLRSQRRLHRAPSPHLRAARVVHHWHSLRGTHSPSNLYILILSLPLHVVRFLLPQPRTARIDIRSLDLFH